MQIKLVQKMYKSFISLLMVALSSSCFGAEVTSFIALDGIKTPQIIVQGSLEEHNPPQKLDFFKEKRESKNKLGILSEYYSYLRNQDSKGAISLFSTKADSQGEFAKMVNSGALSLDRYKNLDRVELLETLEWGSYTRYAVRLIGAGGSSNDWQESIVCEDSCAMFFDIFGEKTDAKFLEQVRQLFWEASDRGKILSEVQTKNMVRIPVRNPGFGSEKPFAFYLNNESFRNNKIVLKECGKSSTNTKGNLFCGIHRVVSQFDLTNSEELESKAGIFAYDGYSSTFPVNKKIDEKEILAHRFVAGAFLSLVREWSEISIKADFKTKWGGYLVYQPTLKTGEKYPFQVLKYELKKSGLKPFFADDGDPMFSLFYSNSFSRVLEKRL